MLVLSTVLLSRLRTSRTALLWDTSAQTEPLPAALPASCGASGCRTEVRCSRCSCCQHLARTSTPLVPQHSDSPGARALRKITLRVPLLFQQSPSTHRDTELCAPWEHCAPHTTLQLRPCIPSGGFVCLFSWQWPKGGTREGELKQPRGGGVRIHFEASSWCIYTARCLGKLGGWMPGHAARAPG